MAKAKRMAWASQCLKVSRFHPVCSIFTQRSRQTLAAQFLPMAILKSGLIRSELPWQIGIRAWLAYVSSTAPQSLFFIGLTQSHKLHHLECMFFFVEGGCDSYFQILFLMVCVWEAILLLRFSSKFRVEVGLIHGRYMEVHRESSYSTQCSQVILIPLLICLFWSHSKGRACGWQRYKVGDVACFCRNGFGDTTSELVRFDACNDTV